MTTRVRVWVNGRTALDIDYPTQAAAVSGIMCMARNGIDAELWTPDQPPQIDRLRKPGRPRRLDPVAG